VKNHKERKELLERFRKAAKETARHIKEAVQRWGKAGEKKAPRPKDIKDLRPPKGR